MRRKAQSSPVVKLPRPRVKELRTLYKGLVNPVAANRHAVLGNALAWYDSAIDYLQQRGKIGDAALKPLETALKIRRKGQSTSEHEKEVCYRMAIQQYEKVCDSLKPILITPYYERLENESDRLTKKQDALGEKYGFSLDVLSQALHPINENGEVVKLVVADGPKERQYNVDLNTLAYNRHAAKMLRTRIRREGLLPVVFDEMKTLARAAALEKKVVGDTVTPVLNTTKQLNSLLQMMENLRQFLPTISPKKLVRRKFEAVEQPEGAEKPKTARIGRRIMRSKPGEEKVAGLYVKGSGKAIVYEMLMDGKTHKLADLQKHLSVDVHGRLRSVAKKGKETGRWTITQDGDSVRMELKDGGV